MKVKATLTDAQLRRLRAALGEHGDKLSYANGELAIGDDYKAPILDLLVEMIPPTRPPASWDDLMGRRLNPNRWY